MTNAEFYLEDLKTKFNKINPTEWYLSYSGGKDSHLLYWFIKEYAHIEGIKVIAINTYMEHPEIRQRMYDYSDEVLLPKMKPFEIKEKYGIPCFSKEQDSHIYYYQNSLRKGKEPSKTSKAKVEGTYKTGYCISKKARDYVLSGNAHMITHLCCEHLKKKPAHDFEKRTGLKCILGTKAGESQLRKRTYTSCFALKDKFTPLWDLNDKLENEIYSEFQIEIPPVYQHVLRTGCMGCPYGSYFGDTERELRLLSPTQKEFVCNYFKESYDVFGIKY